MDPNHGIIMGVNLPDGFKCPGSHHDYAEIILIDKTQPGIQPVLYEIRNEALKENLFHEQKNMIDLGHGSFVMMGGCLSIDRSAKVIRFAKSESHSPVQYTISYKHLIIACGLRHAMGSMEQLNDFCKGLQVLVEASQIREKIPKKIVSPFGVFTSTGKPHKHSWNQDASQEIETLALGYLKTRLKEKDIQEFIEKYTRFFEVQI
ncbi:MAG: hypothetical protein K940chlam3_00728 [Chlamydiae bacterium]|nr:hypothetical protein [Chlamydiota bacterium]